MTVTIRPATAADFEPICALLQQHHLPLDGLPPSLEGFFVAEADGALAGVAGLEPYGRAALLRSVAVQTPGTGVGGALVRHVLQQADDEGTETVYLLTTTAADYFPRFGFQPVSRAEVPEAVTASVEFQGACPASAAVLRRQRRA